MGPPVVVVGLDCPTGLQTARVFDARGVEVIGVASDPKHACARTRACSRVVRGPAEPEGVVRTLVALADELDERAVLVPCTDLAVLGIAHNRQELTRHYRMAVPEPEVIELLLDKGRFAEFARRHGLPMPTTFVVRDVEEARAAADRVDYPCVLKPAVKTVAWSRNVSAKALVASTKAELLDLHRRTAPWADALLIQEWIAGGDDDHYTCDLYLGADGEPLATFTTRKLRQWPPVVGQGCLSVEFPCEQTRRLAIRVMKAADHHGQGYLEVKYDPRARRHLIIEANVGRPTGRSPAAEAAGVELLMTLYSDLIGAPLPAERSQRFGGSKWIHVRRDLQACARLLARGETTLRDVVASWRGPRAHALLSVRDPVPFLADLGGAVVNGFRRLLPSPVADPERPTPREPTAGAATMPTRMQCTIPRAPDPVPVDYGIPGVAHVRILGAESADLRAVERCVGRRSDEADAVPDIVVSFVDALEPSQLTLMDGGRTGYGDGGTYFLSAPGGEALAHVRQGERWGQAIIVCRHGVKDVPCLSAALDLLAISRGWIPLHASAWTWEGSGVIAAGWARSGKTGALLAALERGGRLVGDDRVLLSDDGLSVTGSGAPIVAKGWHLAQLSGTRSPPLRRALAAMTPLLDLAGRAAGSRAHRGGEGLWRRVVRKGLGGLRGLLATEIRTDPDLAEPTSRPELVILLETQRGSEITAERITPTAASRALAAQVEAELLPTLRTHLSLQYPHGSDGWKGVREAPATAARLLDSALRGKRAYVVRHPYPCSLERLHDVIAGLVPGESLSELPARPRAAHVGEVVAIGPAA